MLFPNFECLPSDIDESIATAESASDYVHRMAVEKAQACPIQDAVVVAADTSVILDEQILGKPANTDHARTLLQTLSGRTHRVLTSVAVRRGQSYRSVTVETEVDFVPLSDDLIACYLLTDEPWDKAGAYGIQGFAGSFVSAIRGSYSSVVGLPLVETRELLAHFGLAPMGPARHA
jgi:septum formation protein